MTMVGRTEGSLMPVDFIQQGASSWSVEVDGEQVSTHATQRKALAVALAQKVTHPTREVLAVQRSSIRPTINREALAALLRVTPPVPDPPPEPPDEHDPEPPASWQAAWNTSDPNVMRSWYRANTGIAASGLNDGDLTPSGSVTSTHDGQVLEGLLVSGSIHIHHDNVVIRHTRITNSGGFPAINVPWSLRTNVNSVTVENVSLVSNGSAAEFAQAIQAGAYSRLIVRNVYMNGWRSGIQDFRYDNTLVEYSMIENIITHPGSHNTGMSLRGGSGSVMQRNWIEGSSSSALSLYPDSSPITDFTARENVFDGGNYSVLVDNTKAYGSQSHSLRFLDNRFTRDHRFGPRAGYNGSVPGNQWSGNRYVDGQSVG